MDGSPMVPSVLPVVLPCDLLSLRTPKSDARYSGVSRLRHSLAIEVSCQPSSTNLMGLHRRITSRSTRLVNYKYFVGPGPVVTVGTQRGSRLNHILDLRDPTPTLICRSICWNLHIVIVDSDRLHGRSVRWSPSS